MPFYFNHLFLVFNALSIHHRGKRIRKYKPTNKATPIINGNKAIIVTIFPILLIICYSKLIPLAFNCFIRVAFVFFKLSCAVCNCFLNSD